MQSHCWTTRLRLVLVRGRGLRQGRVWGVGSKTAQLQGELHALGFETFESAVAGGGVLWHR